MRMKTAADSKKRILRISVTVLMCAVFALSLFMFIRSFLPVNSFEMLGLTQYDSAHIVTISGIKAGDKLYSADLKKAEDALLEQCHYIEEIHIERKFPDKLVFHIFEKVPSWYIEISGSYYVLDTGLEVVEESMSVESVKGYGVPQLVLPNLRSAVCGNLPEFGEDDTELKRALELISEINASTLKNRITLVDMESRFDVWIVVDSKYKAYLGKTDNVPEKLDAMQTLLKKGALDGYSAAEIYLTDPANPSVKPIYQ